MSHILIADDNVFTRNQYQAILEKHGHNITFCKDGEECLEKYNEEINKNEFGSIGNPFDVIVLDHNMPKKNGVEVATEIIQKRPTQSMIFATAYSKDVIQSKSKSLENVEILEKPFTLNTFLETIQDLSDLCICSHCSEQLEQTS